MAIIEIKNEYLSVGINTFGSELTYIRANSGEDFLWNGDENVWKLRAPVLFPICGGLKEDSYIYNNKKYNLKKHGFARNSEFEGKAVNSTKAEFILKSSDDTIVAYPFDFVLKITFELIEKKLKVVYDTKNLSEGKMYFSIGAHEGYSCPEGIEEYEIKFEDKKTLDSYILNGNILEDNKIRILENSDTLPLKYEYFLVDALVFKNIDFNKVSLVNKKSGKKIVLEFDKANYFLLWTKPDAKYICLEPWCGVQDIMGSDYDITNKEGIIKLNKNENFEFTHIITF